MPRYEFTGPEPEDFPDPPISRQLQPGEVVEVDAPIEHPHLVLIEDDTSDPEDSPEQSTPDPPSSPEE